VFLTSGIPPFVLRDDLAVRGEEVTAAHPEVHDGALTVEDPFAESLARWHAAHPGALAPSLAAGAHA
jgi:hypothetical protein